MQCVQELSGLRAEVVGDLYRDCSMAAKWFLEKDESWENDDMLVLTTQLSTCPRGCRYIQETIRNKLRLLSWHREATPVKIREDVINNMLYKTCCNRLPCLHTTEGL